ncbi:MAG: hypothetical protein JWP25_7404 [Bradyrhizobium sp.]|jgi:metal-responsive CopG/Arc/MetJ family transcriptional regulator|nr:hypothetical protein [Bradyrhizobium sp.]
MNQPIVVRGNPPEIIGTLEQTTPVSAVRLPAGVTSQIDAWAEAHEVSRSEAIRRLVELGLKAKR